VRRERRIVLNFHGIGAPERSVEADEKLYWISVPFFQAVLDLVRNRHDVHLTFDDGNASDVAIALPALSDRGLSASFYPIADRIGTSGSTSSADLRALRAAGMGIGSHGMRHRAWRHLDDDALREELVDARQLIADAAGHPVTEVACPFGAYDGRTIRRLRSLRYTSVFTSDRAVARRSAWLQPRFTVRNSDEVQDIARLLNGPGSRREDLLASARMTVKRWR
jgi:peptidoglycan/xylan/chitin deacetylase (PgdA/CDA1 family)